MTYSSVLDHSNPLFRDLELLKLSDILSLQLLSFVYDCVNHITPDYFSDYFRHVSDVHSICTRQAIRDHLFIERRRTTQCGIRSVQYSGAKLWNSIPVELRSLKSVSQIRAKLKVYFLSQYKKLDDQKCLLLLLLSHLNLLINISASDLGMNPSVSYIALDKHIPFWSVGLGQGVWMARL